MNFDNWAIAFVALVLSGTFETVNDGEPTDARLGCWREAGGERSLLLEEGRAGWVENGQPRFYRAAYTEKGAVLESWGRESTFTLQMDGEKLRVVGEGEDLLMIALEIVPEELLVAPYVLPNSVEISQDIVSALAGDLQSRRDEDQRVRRNRDPKGDTSEMASIDADNTDFLRNILAEMGWIDAERFGMAASDAAFLIVQHTQDLRLMRTALPHIEKDVRAGRIDGQNFALLHDRLQLNLGYLQRFGSQLSVANGEHLLMPCEDIERVDEFRAEMGMGPLSDYLVHFRSEGDPPIRHVGRGQYVGNE